MIGNLDERLYGPLDPFFDRSRLLPLGTIESVMKQMHDANSP